MILYDSAIMCMNWLITFGRLAMIERSVTNPVATYGGLISRPSMT